MCSLSVSCLGSAQNLFERASPHKGQGAAREEVLYASKTMRSKESTLAKLTDYEIRGRASPLGFIGALKSYMKVELLAIFLTVLDEHREGEIPDHV